MGWTKPSWNCWRPTREDSVIQKFIDKRGEGMHHLALEVDDIEQEIQRAESGGVCVH